MKFSLRENFKMPKFLSGEVLRLFSLLLEYPAPGLERGARRCEALLRERCPEAAGLVGEFSAYAAERGTEGREEDYAAVFDLGSSCPLYVGYHLFGESYKRSAFLLGLRERYRARGFEVPGEDSDHLPVMLRFLSACRDGDLYRELVEEAILPSLDRMLEKSEGRAPAPRPDPLSADRPELDPASPAGFREHGEVSASQRALPCGLPTGSPDCATFCGAPQEMAPMVEADDSPAGEPKERSAAQKAYIGVLKALRLALQSDPPGGAGASRSEAPGGTEGDPAGGDAEVAARVRA